MNNRKSILLMVVTALLLSACADKKDSQRRSDAVKVKTISATVGTESGNQSYSGTIEESSGTTLSFATMGTLKSVSIAEGQMVRQGQLIATVDETSVRNAYEAALAAKEQALDAEQRMRQLHESGSLPEIKWIEVQTQVKQAVASAQIAKKGLTDTKLYAPFSGYIAQKQAETGQSVAPGVPVAKLVKIDQVKVKISVPEEEIAQIQKGQALRVSVPALGGKKFTAKVTEKGVSADALSRAYEVKGIIDNPRHELLPGMIAEVEATVTTLPQRTGQEILLPADIIQIDADNKPFVWTVAGNKAQKIYVTLGQNAGNAVQIANGLKAGDKIIVEGQQKVSTGMKVEEMEN